MLRARRNPWVVLMPLIGQETKASGVHQVTIHLGSNPLKAGRAGVVELTFHLRGLLPGFTYNLLVNEFDDAWGTWREYVLQPMTIQALVQ